MQSFCGRYAALKPSMRVVGMTYLTPIGPWSSTTPGDFLLIGLESPPSPADAMHRNGQIRMVLSGSTAATKRSRKGVFGNTAAQRFLRTVFDTLAVRDILEAEARDAFSYDAEELLLPHNRTVRPMRPTGKKGNGADSRADAKRKRKGGSAYHLILIAPAVRMGGVKGRRRRKIHLRTG